LMGEEPESTVFKSSLTGVNVQPVTLTVPP
jgi:hypothetical protein